MRLVYFAYGSNMLPARLAARCSSARLIGPATTAGYRMAFRKRGMDGSAKATLTPSDGAAKGALFALDAGDLAALDRAEGVGRGYDRHDQVTVLQAGRDLSAFIYIAPEPVDGLLPFDWYLALVLAGATLHGFDPGSIAALRAHPCQRDPDPDRPGRREGLAALTAHGITDPDRLLARG